MAKKKADLAQPSFPELSTVAKIPEGYYSGDKPNPNLRSFVEQKSTPYDPATDDYEVPAFNQPIETTKATAIYNMHVYWSKKPHQAIPIDRSPAATFIAKNHCTPVDPDELRSAFQRVKRAVQSEIDWLYETRC